MAESFEEMNRRHAAEDVIFRQRQAQEYVAAVGEPRQPVFVYMLLFHAPQENPDILGVYSTVLKAQDAVTDEQMAGRMWVVTDDDTVVSYPLGTNATNGMPTHYVQRLELDAEPMV